MHKSIFSLLTTLCVLNISYFMLGCEEDQEDQNNGASEVAVNTDFLGECEPGAVKSCGQNNCYGTITCPADGKWPGEEACAYPAELCDGFDQDCDGDVDEDFSNLGESCSSNEELCGINGVYVCNTSKDDVECAVDSTSENLGDEICNEIDDDCDGQIDENFNVGGECASGQGACEVTGSFICNEEGLTTCSATENMNAVSDELCDGIDNDCDGTVDEEIDASTLSEDCNGEDDDCDGRVDEDFDVGELCLIGEGICASEGEYECTRSGRGIVCIGSSSGDGTTETCNDLDDDCDGNIDEDFNAGEDCTVGEGVCQGTGVYVCNEDQNSSSCNTQENLDAQTQEVCNGVDDDCDGQLDEDRSFTIDVRNSDDLQVRMEYKTLVNGKLAYHAIDLTPNPNASSPELDESMQYYFNEAGDVDYIDWDIDGNGRIDYRKTMVYENNRLAFQEVTEIRNPEVIERWFYIYDAMNHVVRIDKDSGADGDIEFEVHYSYDEQGRLASEDTRDLVNNVNMVVTYNYNEDGRLSSSSYEDNGDDLSQQYYYNDQSWVATVELLNATVSTEVQTYTYQCELGDE
jgi:hypothetical protein